MERLLQDLSSKTTWLGRAGILEGHKILAFVLHQRHWDGATVDLGSSPSVHGSCRRIVQLGDGTRFSRPCWVCHTTSCCVFELLDCIKVAGVASKGGKNVQKRNSVGAIPPWLQNLGVIAVVLLVPQ